MMRVLPRRLRGGSVGMLLAMAAGACGPGGRAVPAPAPPPAPAPAPPVVARDDGWRDVRVCVVDEQGVRQVPARYDVTTGDTLVDGRPFLERFPLTEAYAEGAEWYVNNEPFKRGSYWYVKYGLPRVVRPHEIVLAGKYRGVILFAEAEPGGDFEGVLYAAVRPGCEFQAYQRELVRREGDG